MTDPHYTVRPFEMLRGRYESQILRKENWRAKFGFKHEQIRYTDEPKTGVEVGAGVYEPNHKVDFSLRLEKYNTVFKEEILAINRYTEELSATNKISSAWPGRLPGQGTLGEKETVV